MSCLLSGRLTRITMGVSWTLGEDSDIWDRARGAAEITKQSMAKDWISFAGGLSRIFMFDDFFFRTRKWD